MTEVERIADQLRRVYDGDAWYGSPTVKVLDGITAEQAARRAAAGAHTIWEILLHMTAWKREVRRRLLGGWAGLPEEGDWPPVGDTSGAAWRAARAAFDRAHRELLETAASLDDARLDDPSRDKRDRPTGAGVSLYVLLHGIVQHDVYHTGQIALLKKAL